MSPDADRQRDLQSISTVWSQLAVALRGQGETARAAQHALLERYSLAVYRYLLGALRDRDAADDAFQTFVTRFLEGRFSGCDPGKGSFRGYLKRALANLIADVGRRKPPTPLPEGAEPAVADPSTPDAEREFREAWREELMGRAWQALADLERQTGQPHHTVLRLRAAEPLLSSEELANRVGERLGKAYTVDGIRKALQRAREKFAEFLVEEAARSLERPTPERLEEELRDLGLWSHCQAAVRTLRR